jgi:hypothetical protein
MSNPQRVPTNTQNTTTLLLLEALAGAGTGAIERQEAQGQREIVASEVLPADCLHPGMKPLLERLGFVLGEKVKGDDLFAHATLPPGWRREGSSHAMWSYILDDQGRKRVAIFYKAAFYDRRASTTFVGRFEVRYPDNNADPRQIIDNKTGAVVFSGDREAVSAWFEALPTVDAVTRWEAE